MLRAAIGHSSRGLRRSALSSQGLSRWRPLSERAPGPLRQWRVYATEETAGEQPRRRGSFLLRALGVAGLGVGGVGLYLWKTGVTAPTPDAPSTLSPSAAYLLRSLPYRSGSRLFGSVANVEFPPWLLTKMIMLYSSLYKCNLEEMEHPLEEYKSMAHFFTRRLRKGMRTLEDGALLSPVDGTVLIVNETEIGEDPVVEQVKGVAYKLNTLIGGAPNIAASEEAGDEEAIAEKQKKKKKKKIYHCIVYLAPGDYHGIHSPASWTIDERVHVVGELFSVHPALAAVLPGLFAMNERVVFNGQWEQGFFSMISVGATNVGSITLTYEPEFLTNLKDQDKLVASGGSFRKPYQGGLNAEKGEELAFFNMGSTVILAFESEPFEWAVKAGDSVRLGQCMGRYADPSHRSPSKGTAT